MKPEVKAKLDDVFNYPFFQSVGKTLPPTVTPLKSWLAASESCRSYKWETCQLMARNALQRKIEARYPEDTVNHYFWHRLQEWGPLGDELKPITESFVDALLPKIPLKDKNLQNIKNAFLWDIFFICLECNFADVVKPIFYIPVIEPWYAAGHFPCGWDGDEFPEDWDGVVKGGQLMAF